MTGCISICFLTGKINFDHLIKVVFARFLYKATLFLFVSNKYLVGNTLRLCKYSISYTLTHYINIHWWFLPATNRFGKWWSSSPIIPASFINWDSTVRKSSSASLNQLFISIWIHGHLFYSVGYNPLLYFDTHVVLDVAIGSTFKLTSCVFLIRPCLFFFFFFCIPSEAVSGSSSTWSSLVLLSVISPRSFGFFYWRMVSRNQDSGCKVFTLLLSIWGKFGWLDEDGNESWLSKVIEGYSQGKHPPAFCM